MVSTISNSLPFIHTCLCLKHKMIHIDCETMNVCLECMHVCIFCIALFISSEEWQKKIFTICRWKVCINIKYYDIIQFSYLHMCFVFHSTFYIYYAICHVQFSLAQDPHNCLKVEKNEENGNRNWENSLYIYVIHPESWVNFNWEIDDEYEKCANTHTKPERVENWTILSTTLLPTWYFVRTLCCVLCAYIKSKNSFHCIVCSYVLLLFE